MTEQNELYVKSQENWLKEQNLLIEMIEANLDNSKTMISIHKRNEKLLLDSLEFEQHNLKRNAELFDEWKLNNL